MMTSILSEAINKIPDGWWKSKPACDKFSDIFKGYILGLLISGLFSDKQQSYLYSGFLFCIDDTIIWFTAGHVTQNITDVILNTPIEDFLGRWIDWEDNNWDNFIPVNFKNFPLFSGCKNNCDLGMYILSPQEKEIIVMNTNSICFEKKHVIGLETFQPEGFYLLGFPKDLREETITETTTFYKSPIDCVPIERMTYSKDIPFDNPDPRFFYGKVVDFSDNPKIRYSIDGMSGGPIIGIKKDAIKGADYRLYAIQSCWLPESRIVQAIPITIPLDLIEKMNNSSNSITSPIKLTKQSI